ncbi:MAG TPA: hypothetical protein PKE47_14665, partial [Verrucomicrobiota bacterium]|nr:hypothetical protein [Verrucomicrobiota bacterium]
MAKKHRNNPVAMKMSRALKQGLLGKLQARYARRDREGKGLMLDELCEDFGFERKYAIRLLRGGVPAPGWRPRPGPERQYESLEPVVREIWLAAEQPCGKRLAPALALWRPHYERRHGRLNGRQRQLVEAVSAATLDRILAPARAQHPRRGRCGTRPGGL